MAIKVLWFPGNGSIYANTNIYNGGGWTSALAYAIKSKSNIELGMAIPWNNYFKESKNDVIFYGIPPIRHGIFRYNKKLDLQINTMKSIVDDFKPDIIHVFGSEHTGGMVATVTNIPVVLHIQGILNMWAETWLPQNMSWEKFMTFHPRQWFHKRTLYRACKTELTILKSCHNYMGRTEMDSRVSSLLSINRKYYYCSEMLRPIIYNSKKTWQPHYCHNKKIIISIISSPIYKGGDIILRTAKTLKNYTNLNFEWYVFGIKNLRDWESLTGIEHKSVNVKIGGIISAEELVNNVINADVYVHPSYIENSPNTICETQLLGIPVIACYVGGTPTLVNHNETGILVPSNDIYQTASYINELCIDTNKAIYLGRNAREKALKRHDPNTIVTDLLNIYKDILNND